MPAHDSSGEGPAHASPLPPEGRPKRVQIDSSGISMDWRVALTVLLILTGSGGMTVAQIFDRFGVATTGDVSNHNVDQKAHRINGTDKGVVEFVLDQDASQKDLVEKVESIETKVDTVVLTLEDQKKDLSTQQRVLFDFRAESLGEQAAKKIRDPERSREVSNRVRERALRNLESGRSARDGLEGQLP